MIYLLLLVSVDIYFKMIRRTSTNTITIFDKLPITDDIDELFLSFLL